MILPSLYRPRIGSNWRRRSILHETLPTSTSWISNQPSLCFTLVASSTPISWLQPQHQAAGHQAPGVNLLIPHFFLFQFHTSKFAWIRGALPACVRHVPNIAECRGRVAPSVPTDLSWPLMHGGRPGVVVTSSTRERFSHVPERTPFCKLSGFCPGQWAPEAAFQRRAPFC